MRIAPFFTWPTPKSQNKPLEMIEREYAQLWSDRAFPGEWVQKENGTWTQK
jgi:uncharacterized protein YdbL (DUF1318 family)